MDYDLIIILRLVQTVLSLITLGLNASVIHYFNSHEIVGDPPGYLVVLVFTSVLTVLISNPYTTFCPQYFPSYINRWASLAFELVTTIFWFGGFIGGVAYLVSLNICAGLMCSNARAGIVFAALTFACFCVTSYFPIKYCFFHDQNNALGDQNWKIGMSGAERISRTRTKRDAANNARIHDGKHTAHSGRVGAMLAQLKDIGDVVRVRAQNVVDQWKIKAGRDGQRPQSEMQQQYGMSHNTVPASSMGNRGYGHASRSVSPLSGNMV